MLTTTSALLALFLVAPAIVPPDVPEPGVTFLVCADPHYGQDQWADDEALNKDAIDRMNAIRGTAYPAAIGGGLVEEPRGVLVCGDLTDTGETTNWSGYWFLEWREGFDDDYARDGQGRIRYPVYEGYGNHDIHDPADGAVLDGIRDRNATRPGLTNVSSNGLHYSWDWGEVHFVNLNVYPGGAGDAEHSLDFLIDDLATHVGTSGRPVVLYHHYGLDLFSLSWWTPAERAAYGDAIEPYRVVAIFHGHSHSVMHKTWRGIDVYNVARVKDQRYFVVRINEREMTVAERVSDGWGRTWRKTWRRVGTAGTSGTGSAIGRVRK